MTRLVTAIFFVAIVLGGIYTNQFTFGILFLVVTMLCLWEFYQLTFNTTKKLWYKLFAVLIAAYPVYLCGFLSIHYHDAPEITLPLGLSIYIPLLFIPFLIELFGKAKAPFTNLGWLYGGMVYISIPFCCLMTIALQEGQYFPNLVFGILWLIWTNDTAAYLIGSMIGKTPLFPRISPKKTWEGSISGVIVTILMAVGLSYVFTELAMPEWMIIAVLVAIFGSTGDLVESMLKRSLGVKDSGKLLPGHGGFLDRFDAFIFVLPFVAAYLMLIRLF